MNRATFALLTGKTDSNTNGAAVANAIVPPDVTTTPTATVAEKARAVLARFTGNCKVWIDYVNAKLTVTNATAVKTAVDAAAVSNVLSIEIVPLSGTSSSAQFIFTGGTAPSSPNAAQQMIIDLIEARRPKLSFDAVIAGLQDAYPNGTVVFDQTSNKFTVHTATWNPANSVPSNPATQTACIDFVEIVPQTNTPAPNTPFGG